MYKWAIIIGSILIVTSALIFRFLIQPRLATQVKNPVLTQTITEDRISAIESAVEEISKQLSQLKEATLEATSSGTINNSPLVSEVRLQNAEQAITILQSQVNSLRGITPGSTTTPSSTKSVVYIPLGSSGTSTSLDYTSNTSFQASINPDNYPGYTSMQLEVIMRVLNGNGRAYSRIFNSTSGTSILTSEVSTSSSDYTLLTSSTFTLPAGVKNYILQMKSQTGYENSIQSARIKVNF